MAQGLSILSSNVCFRTQLYNVIAKTTAPLKRHSRFSKSCPIYRDSLVTQSNVEILFHFLSMFKAQNGWKSRPSVSFVSN